MKLSYDLHIHSALSPCGDDDMTPNNIVNMALIKELDVISVTDHNSILNIESIINLASKQNILVIPGIEITTKEDIHILGYFKDVSDAFKFYNVLYKNIPSIKNKESIFGNQLVLDREDKILYKEDKLLISSAKFTLKEVFNLINRFNGIGVPAHIDKVANSIISTLGFLPNDIEIKTVEISNNVKNFNYEKYKDDYNIIVNSDAHYLKDISEPNNLIETNEKSIEGVFEALRFRRSNY